MELEPFEPKIKDPVLFIIGSTASGKTKLSLEIAKLYKQIEIVNADSLQIYKGADIMTAKATKEEREIVPHHVLDIIPLEKLDFERKDYFNIASKEIGELHNKGKIPLVVGGTNYYIESLLYNDYDLIEGKEDSPPEIEEMHETITKKFEENKELETEKILKEEEDDEDDHNVPDNWRDLTAKEKHNLLGKIDPLIAEKIHPNDVKRVDNYIKVYVEENVIPSKKIMKLDSKRKLRYENTLILWVKDKEKVKLNERIEKRIHEMVNIEGVKEIIWIFGYMEKFGPFNFQRGVLQSIGYKEFYDFYCKLKEYAQKQGIENVSDIVNNLESIEGLAPELRESLEECKRKLITSTETYAKQQLTWIRNRLYNQPILKNRIFLLEFTEVSKFQEQALDKGREIVQNYLRGELVIPSNEDENDQDYLVEKYKGWKRHFCDVCEINLSGDKEWEIHIKSKRHKKTKERIAKHKRNMEMKLYYEKQKEQGKEETEEGLEENS